MRIFIAIFMLVFAVSPAYAVEREGIAAVVNESIVTFSDIKDRSSLITKTSNRKIDAATLKKIELDTLDALINETLQKQEAKKAGVKANPEDIDKAFEQLSNQNGLSAEQFKKALKQKKVPIETLKSQIEAQIVWSKLIQRQLRPKINVTERDIDAEFDNIEKSSGQEQYNLAEILVATGNGVSDKQAKSKANALIARMKKGERFSKLALEESDSPGASRGGDLGWINIGQLDKSLEDKFTKMNKSSLSDPIKTDKGYHILFLRNKKLVPVMGMAEEDIPKIEKFTLRQILIPVGPKDTNGSVRKKQETAVKLIKSIKSCKDMEKKSAKFKNPGTKLMGKFALDQLPKPISDNVKNVKKNKVAKPMFLREGISIMMVCDREMEAVENISRDDNVSREKVATEIGLVRLDRLQKSYLQDLRATALIDKRI